MMGFVSRKSLAVRRGLALFLVAAYRSRLTAHAL